jgi:hypothetical protein
MAASLGSFGLALVVSLLAASACSGNTGSDGNGAAGKASGGSVSGGGSSGGSVSHAGSASGGSASGGSANTGGSVNMGGSSSSGGTGNATAGAAGAAGDSKACQSVDDCIIASVFGNAGCCTRTDCGGGYNRAWVLGEPCASANSNTDPVPASCSQGCLACPASQCAEPVGVLCTSGKCEAVTREGPCTTDADCVLALDYTSSSGDCCSCPDVVSKAYEEAVECVALEGAAKPAGCMFGAACATVGCPATCTKPTPVCKMGRCAPG